MVESASDEILKDAQSSVELDVFAGRNDAENSGKEGWPVIGEIDHCDLADHIAVGDETYT